MSELETPPIIVKKIKKHEGHHGGAWKVAYADFVTAMMALFIVLWVLNQDDSTKESISHYFKDPIGYSTEGKTVLPGNAKDLSETGTSNGKNKANEIDKLKRMGDRLITEISRNPEFIELKGQIDVQLVDEGLKIELLESAKDVFYEVGTAKLKSEAKKLIESIGRQLSKLTNKIVIEGHTDSRPYSGNGLGYTNFELSSDRANSARRALLLGGLNDKQIEEIRGYADRKLRNKNDPFSASNRRVSILVKFSSKSEKKHIML